MRQASPGPGGPARTCPENYGRRSTARHAMALASNFGVSRSRHGGETLTGDVGQLARGAPPRRVIPFDRKFGPEEADNGLFPKIWEPELSGISGSGRSAGSAGAPQRRRTSFQLDRLLWIGRAGVCRNARQQRQASATMAHPNAAPKCNTVLRPMQNCAPPFRCDE
jgi:hypothetical protein